MKLVTCKPDYIDFLGIRVTTLKELKATVEEMSKTQLSFYCSSSMDWPDEYTSDPELIYLCDIIRGNNVSGRNPKFHNLKALFNGELETE